MVALQDARQKEKEMGKKKDTVAYIVDTDSALTPCASLIVTSYGGDDVEEAWLRKHFAGLWDDEEGREYADALLEGMGDIYSGDFTPAYSVLVETVDVHLVDVDYEDDALAGDDAVAAMMCECEALNLTVGDASVGEILSVLNHIDSDITDRLGVNG
jgi:hypothetical protein